MSDLVTGFVSALFEVFFAATGRRLLRLFGWRHPHEIVCIFTGMVFWMVMGVLGYAMLHR
jgi:hypothetical protein